MHHVVLKIYVIVGTSDNGPMIKHDDRSYQHNFIVEEIASVDAVSQYPKFFSN